MVAEFDKIDRWQLRFGKRRPGCKWRSSFSRKTHCDMFPLWITIRGQSYHWDNFGRSLWPKHCFKDQLPSSAWAFNTFFFNFKILFSSATVAVRFSSRSLLTGLWRKTSTWRMILMKRRNRPYIYCISCIWHLTFVLIVFADWALEKNPPGWRYWWRERIKYTNQPTTRSRPHLTPKKIHNKIEANQTELFSHGKIMTNTGGMLIDSPPFKRKFIWTSSR